MLNNSSFGFRILAASLVVTILFGCGGSSSSVDPQAEQIAKSELTDLTNEASTAAPLVSSNGIEAAGSLSHAAAPLLMQTKKKENPAGYVPGRVLLLLNETSTTSSNGLTKNSVKAAPTPVFAGFQLTPLAPKAVGSSGDIAKQESQSFSKAYVATITDGSTVERAIAKLKGNPLVADAEPDYVWKRNAAPNDPLYSNQWYLKNTGAVGRAGFDIGAETGWDLQGGSQNIVAILDDGVRLTHPDLSGAFWTNLTDPINGLDDDNDGFIDNINGADAANIDGDPTPDFASSSHGTRIAGIIAASRGNGIGVAGINQNAKLMPIKIEDNQGNISTSSLIRGLNFIQAKKRAGVNVKTVSFSLSSTVYSSITRDAFKSLTNQGVLVIVAAGNSGLDTAHNRVYPMSYKLPGVISVAATAETGALASFSNFGADVDIAAPGSNISSTSFNSTLGATYETSSGTSFSAPIVAGIVSSLWSRFPGDSAALIKNKLLAGGSTYIAGSTTLDRLVRTNRHATMATATFPCSGEPEMLRQQVSINGSSSTNMLSQNAEHLVEALVPRCATDVNSVWSQPVLGLKKTLMDDGIFPDRMAGDGIYSGAIVPKKIGTQTLTVRVLGQGSTPTSGSTSAEIVVGQTGNYLIEKSPVNPLTFTSIAVSGIKLVTGDDSSVNVSTPFPLPFYGFQTSGIAVSSNGRICLKGGAACSDPTDWSFNSGTFKPNSPIPEGRQSNRSLGYIAPWWWDWRSASASGSPSVGVFTLTTGVSPNRKYIVSWEGMRNYDDETESPTGNNFQVVFTENSPHFDIVYGSLLQGTPQSNGAKGTIGVQYFNGVIGTQMSHDTANVGLANKNHRYMNYAVSFADTALNAWRADIEGLRGSGLTPGCAGVGGTVFCPDAPVSRGSMAVWIVKALKGNSYEPVAAHFFPDEPTSLGWGPYLDEFKRLGLSPGCQGEGGSLFCPFADVSRGSMSVWLVKGLMGSSFVPPAPTGVFVDSPVAHVWTPYIELFRLMGISPGCSGEGGSTFCTNSSITRSAAAAWLQRAFRFFDYDAVQ
jgi:hypothetical protein